MSPFTPYLVFVKLVTRYGEKTTIILARTRFYWEKLTQIWVISGANLVFLLQQLTVNTCLKVCLSKVYHITMFGFYYLV